MERVKINRGMAGIDDGLPIAPPSMRYHQRERQRERGWERGRGTGREGDTPILLQTGLMTSIER